MACDRFDHFLADPSQSHGIDATRSAAPLPPLGLDGLQTRVDDVQARYAELAGQVLFAPEDTHRGTRWFVVRDPDDNLIAFEQPL